MEVAPSRQELGQSAETCQALSVRWIESALLTVCMGGCTAAVHGQATPQAATGGAEAALDAELEAELQVERQRPSANTTTAATKTGVHREPPQSVSGSSGLRLALLGARHDLRLSNSADETCRCLAVHAGDASDPMFIWEANAPQVDPDAHLVVAFADDTQACGGSGAAYRGYQTNAGDVVVLIEAAVPGRPALSGAIIPRPRGEGRLWIQPTPATLPYGQPLQGTAERCAVPFDGSISFDGPLRASAASSTASDFAAGVGEVAETAPADEGPEEIPLDEGPHSQRDGFYLGVQPALEYPMVDLVVGTASASASGVGFGFDLLVGTSVAPGFTVGGAIGGAAAPQPELTLTLPTGEQFSERLDGASLNVFRLGAVADYYPFSRLGFHVLAEVGYASVGISGTSDDAESLHGFSASGGVGWDFWVSYHLSLGLLARLQWALLRGDGSEGTALLSPALAATLTFH